MDITVTEFKASCHKVICMVQKEKSHVTINHLGKPAAELIPISSNSSAELFGRSMKTTLILGDLLTTDEDWHAED